jgi:hypothetical protein
MSKKGNGSIVRKDAGAQQRYLPVVNRSLSILIPLEEIVYIERKGRVVVVVALDQEYRYYERMDAVLAHLDGHFYQCLRGTVVNLRNIRKINEQHVEFVSGVELALSYKPYCRLKQVYSNYILNGRKGFVYWREESMGE